MSIQYTNAIQDDRVDDKASGLLIDNHNLPVHWKIVKLENVLREVDIRAEDLKVIESEQMPVLSLTKNKGLILQSERFNNRVATQDISNYKITKEGQIVYNPFVLWEGAIYALKGREQGLVSPVYLVWEATNVNNYFLDFLLRTPQLLNEYLRVASGVVQRRRAVRKGTFLNIRIPLPPPPEQQSIVQVLQTVYEATHARHAELELERERKAALVEHLFTYGPISIEDASQVPMKQTVFGTVPQHWDLKQCAEICQTISVGIVVRPASYYVSSGVPAFRSLNVREDRLSTKDLVFISNEANDSVLAKSKLRKGDVLIVRTGEPGTSCIVPAEFDGSNCIDIIFARPNADLMTSEFLSRFMNTSIAKSQAFKARTGIAQQHLNVGAVHRILVPMPPLKEQQEIVNVLSACDDKISALEGELSFLQELFHTLLEELMTGRLSTLPLIVEGETHE